MKISILDMRDAFFDALYLIAKSDKNVVLLTDDFGAPSLDKFRKDLAKQYINAGISEQNMVSVAAGLALCDKKVYMYAISPFVTVRCYDQIKVDLCVMNLPVTAVGVGAGFAYDNAGPTHHSIDDISVMRVLPNMTVYSPSDSVMAAALAEISYKSIGPEYIRFDRGKTQIFYDDNEHFGEGLKELRSGEDVLLISSGVMTGRAHEIAHELEKSNLKAGVIDLYRIKPLNEKLLLKIVSAYDKIVTLEEHLLGGGLGSLIAEFMADNKVLKPLKRIAISDSRAYSYGDRKSLQAYCGLDLNSCVKCVLDWIKS
jgi:transketolase